MYASLDLHKKYSQAVVLEHDGTILREERLENEHPNEMERFSASLPADTEVVIESSSTWYWVYRILSKRHHVVLSNPLKTKAIASAKLKTDRVDALTLANLLRGGYIAESYIPTRKTMELRELVRHRANLVRMRSQLKNRIHAHLLMNNIRVDAGPFTKEFLQQVRSLGDIRVQSYLRLIDSLNEEIHTASTQISREAMGNEEARLLMTIPGISFYSALLIASEIGDVNRFADSNGLVAYAGLAPSTHSSGGTTYHGRITKTGSPYLRWILNQCVRANIRAEPDGTVALFYNRLVKKKGSPKSAVAASAKMLRIVYWVLKERRPYHS
jgi:transposase